MFFRQSQENRHSQISETDRSKHSGSDLQVTPPGRTFLSGTCGPAQTYRWRGYPQCPGREALITLRERHFWNRCEVCLDHSPLLVLEPFGSVSTPDCSQTHLQRQRHPVNHSTCGTFRYSGVIENSRRETLLPATVRPFLITMSQRWLLFAQDMVRIIASSLSKLEWEERTRYIYRSEQATFIFTKLREALCQNHTLSLHLFSLQKSPRGQSHAPSLTLCETVWGRWRIWLLCLKIHSGTQVMEKECWTLINCWQQLPTILFGFLHTLSKFCVCNVVISIREVGGRISSKHACITTTLLLSDTDKTNISNNKLLFFTLFGENKVYLEIFHDSRDEPRLI